MRDHRIVTDSTPPAQPKDPDTCTLVALLRAFARLATGEQYACQRADRALARTVVAMGL